MDIPRETPTILVVDDDPDIVEVLTLALEDEGYGVLSAIGAQAPAVAHDQQPAMILLDINMPGMDGVEVSRRLRADPTMAATPIVVMTTHPTIRERAGQMQADDLLAKPFDLADLYATVLAWTAP